MDTVENSSASTQEATVTPTKSAKKGGQKMAAKGKAKVKAGAWKKDPKRLAQTKREWPLGSIVKYTGSRVDSHEGKTGTVIGYRDANGLSVDFGKLGKGSISIPKAEMVRRGKGEVAKEEKSA